MPDAPPARTSAVTMVVDRHSRVPSASGWSVGTVYVRVTTSSMGTDTSASPDRRRGLDQEGVHEGLGQVAAQLALGHVVLLREQAA
jgi:hypothetical protein